MRTKKAATIASVSALAALGSLGLLASCSSSSTSPSQGYFGPSAGSSGKGGAAGKQSAGGSAGTAGASAGGEAGESGEGQGGDAGSGVGASGGSGGSGGNGQGASAGDGQGATGGTTSAGGNMNSGGQAGSAPDVFGGGGAPDGGVNDGGVSLDCNFGPNDDHDGDGWTPATGDCNDCDKYVNPGAIDVLNYKPDAMGKPTEELLPNSAQVDEDCNGKPLLPTDDTSCDGSLSVGAVADPYDAAKAMELCNVQVEENPADPKMRKWGVIQAAFNEIAGAPFKNPPPNSAKWGKTNFGLLPDFGAPSKPRAGTKLFGLSSGEARAPGQPDFTDNVCGFDKGYASGYPAGFPKQGSCGTTGAPHDGVALDLKIRVPTNAKSMLFDFRFFTCEFPVYVCDMYNDVFAVLMSPSPLMAGDPMADSTNQSANIAFEASGNMKSVIGVNNQSFLTACSPGTSGYNNCKGEAELAGSGFEGHGGSAWLESQVPVIPGSTIFLRLAIWDSADGILDSSAIVDNFRFSANEGANTNTHVAPDP
jgi:hypothetical protein